MVKILHINTFDIEGGAARAAYRLHRALLAENVDSQMFVQFKSSDDFTVLTFDGKLERLIARFRPFLDSLPVRWYKNRTQTVFSSNILPFSQIPKYINAINPDIVHIHWINGGMLSVSDLAKINKPIIWSLHDMWAFTGGEHYDEGQKNYLDKAGNSKVLNSNKNVDLSTFIWKVKQKIYSKIDNLYINGLSKWLYNESKSSSLLKDKRHFQLPNLIDTEQYSPIDKKLARKILDLSTHKKIVLFGAMGATSDPRKGFKELNQALFQLNDNDIELVVFGSSEPKNPPKFNQKVHYLGQLHDDISLKILYNAVDVMVVPSLQENLSNAIMESLACGTPVVAFDVGGNSDLIDHKNNGYLAKPYDTQDLAQGINWVLHNNQYQQLCDNARTKVLTTFDSHIVAQQYIKLYQEILLQ